MRSFSKKTKFRLRVRAVFGWTAFFFLVYLILVIKVITFEHFPDHVFYGTYSIAVGVYLLSRFALAYFYEPEPGAEDGENGLPSVSFAVPAKNEEEHIRKTILCIAKSRYPKDKFDIIAVNDGSSDRTLAEMYAAKKIAHEAGVGMTIINWKENKGKRAGMAACVEHSRKNIIIFVDSDSFVEPDTARELVRSFSNPAVAAATGHSFVANRDVNMLTRMQAVRYFLSFKTFKAAESLFGSVTCCSGCCSAYRRDAVLTVLDRWAHQTFLGVRCTYGDDRSLTNALLEKGYAAVFAPRAIAYTIVPETFRQFMRQQMRWKKSWIRESARAAAFMWKKNPLMAVSFYLGFILPFFSPIIVVRALVWFPYHTGKAPLFYIFGIFLMALLYGLYYYIHTQDKKWLYGVFFTNFYALALIWQFPYALLNLKDSRWGTR